MSSAGAYDILRSLVQRKAANSRIRSQQELSRDPRDLTGEGSLRQPLFKEECRGRLGSSGELLVLLKRGLWRPTVVELDAAAQSLSCLPTSRGAKGVARKLRLVMSFCGNIAAPGGGEAKAGKEGAGGAWSLVLSDGVRHRARRLAAVGGAAA